MYQFLLCLRYIRTRYIALASIISVMLGVATMIVVNSVMSGFQLEMYNRLHGILSDLVIEAKSLDGITDPEQTMEEIRKALGSDLEAMTANVHVPAMLSFKVRNEWIVHHVSLIGVDTETCGDVSDVAKHLLHPDNRQELSFLLREHGYPGRLPESGWGYRRKRAALEVSTQRRSQDVGNKDHAASGVNPFAALDELEEPELFDAAREQHTGIVLGIALASFRHRQDGVVEDYFLCRPGDDVKITVPNATAPPKPVHDNFTIVDFYESQMSEYDSTFAFVPITALQQLRGMIDPQTGIGAVTTIQIRLRPNVDLAAARDKLRAVFPAYLYPYQIQTWKDMQGPLLAAVQLETTILNILLFLIIAVAGFGILATFFMIVVEKTKDIGILKSLGASSRGIMAIFLGYGLLLGIVGSGVGMVLGLLFVWKINSIADLISHLTGQEVFDPTIYYFQSIPTLVEPFTVLWIVVGALTIAVTASVLPALRASRLNPVEALRYE